MTPTTAPVIEFPSPGAELQYQTPAPGALVVRSPAEYVELAERKKTIKVFQRRVKEWFKPLKLKADATKNALLDEERKLLRPSEEDEARIDRALVTFTTEQDRIRREETLRLQAEQRKKDEDERLEQAAALEREGTATGEASYTDAAQALMDAPMAIAPVEPETPAAPKVEGLSYRETYRAQVLDLMTLVKAVAAGQQPIGLLLANQSALDGMARSLKHSMAIPGVHLLCDKTPVTRTR